VPPLRHRVARIDRQVQQRHLDLVGVGHHAVDPGRDLVAQRHGGTDRGRHQFADAAEQGVDRHRAQVQALVAREGQQLAGELGAAAAGVARDLGALLHLLVARQHQDQVHIALHDVQQVVEVVRDAAGQAPDRFHLLQLGDGLQRALALDDFLGQAVVGLGQRAGAFLDARFQCLVELHQLVLAGAQVLGGALALDQHVACLVLAPACAQCRAGGTDQGLHVQRAFELDHVAEVGLAGQSAAADTADRTRYQQHQRKIGPGFLACQACDQALQRRAFESLVGDDGAGGARIHAGQQGIDTVQRGTAETLTRERIGDHFGVAAVRGQYQQALLEHAG
jgi:hypothetical protein